MRARAPTFFVLLAGAAIGYVARIVSEPPPPRGDVSNPSASLTTDVVAASRPAVATPSRRGEGDSLAAKARTFPRVTVDFVPPATDDELITALRGAFTDPIDHRRNKAFLDLLEFLTPESAVRIVDVFGEFYHRGIQQDLAWRTFWTRWGEIDGAGALEFAIGNPKFARSGHLHIEKLMQGWSAVDPAGAEHWLRENPDKPHYGWMASALAQNWAISNPDEATAMVFALPLDPDSVNRTLGSIAETLRLTGGQEKVGGWFDRLTESQKAVAFRHASSRIKDGDVGYAREWFTTQADKPWREDQQLGEFVRRYSDQDPRAAAEWLVTLPPPTGAPYSGGMSTAFERWTASDAPAVANWLSARTNQAW